MKLENIIKKLAKDGKVIYKGEFDFKECWMCQGTALVDLINGSIADTSAKYDDVLSQIQNNKSHILTVEGKKKTLTSYNKLGF